MFTMQVFGYQLKGLALSICFIFVLGGCNSSESMKESGQENAMEQGEKIASPIGEAQSEQLQEIDSVSNHPDSELKEFIIALKEVEAVQQGFEKDMIQIIESEKMEIERFEQIAQQIKMGKEPEQSEDEKLKFEKITNQFAALQTKQEAILSKAIEGTGMDVEQYMSILQDVRQDPQLQTRIGQLVNEEVGKVEGQ